MREELMSKELYLNVDSVRLQLALGAHLLVNLAVPLGEAPLLRNVDLRRKMISFK